MKRLFAGLLVMILFATKASACSCAVRTLAEFAVDADTIYFATLQQARLLPGDYPEKWPRVQGTFKIRKVLKGKAPGGLVELETSPGGASCGLSMVVAENYIIFKKDQFDSIVACSGSGIVEPFEEDSVSAKIEAIIKKHPPKKLPKA